MVVIQNAANNMKSVKPPHFARLEYDKLICKRKVTRGEFMGLVGRQAVIVKKNP